jgi:hypothetical protein
MASNAGTKLHGKNGAIYIGSCTVVAGEATGITDVKKVASKTEWTLNLNRDYVDATVFGDSNKTYLVGLKDIQGQWNGLLDVSGDLLVNASDSDAMFVYLYSDDRPGLEVLVASGPGLFDASITSAVSDAVKASGNFRAAGHWTVFTTGT